MVSLSTWKLSDRRRIGLFRSEISGLAWVTLDELELEVASMQIMRKS